MLAYSRSWFVDKQTPYIGNNLYPPLASVLFTPLIFMQFSWAYTLVTFVSIICYLLMTFVLPLRIGQEKHVSPLLLLVLVTGLSSYGLQFELERGQFNLIAVFLVFLAIWIYHDHNRYRFVAYGLFTISVQLKVFPLIFIVMFIRDWHDWKNNIKRVLVLIAANLALCFVLGPSVFVDFVKAITAQTVDPAVWTGNHSIRSFVAVLAKIASDQGWGWVNQYSGLIQIVFLALIVFFIFLIMLQTYRQKLKGINPFLLLACTIGALLIPPVSHDYKLSILAAPVALLFSSKGFLEKADTPRKQIFLIEMLFIFSAAYTSTLFSYTNKPLTLNNNFPALLIMLGIVTLLSLVSMPGLEGAVPGSGD